MTKLYPYQERVRQAILAGRSVIVQAPTGAGKTRGALYPFFENLDRYAENIYPVEAPLPLTCRYAVPTRVLATQFEREYRDWFTNLDRRRATRLLDRYERKLDLKLPAIQTGETPQDPAFESPLTFCTIDQLLASFIGTPYSLSGRQANMNVGAVVGSYLVLDEFHLYPLDASGGARTTSLAMLRLLKGLCRFVLMTATFSTSLLQLLGELLDADIVRMDNDGEMNEIMRGRTRTIRVSQEAMTATAILTALDGARKRQAGASLVICNTVARAQQVYQDLKDALEAQGRTRQVRMELLHSRFTPQHRHAKSQRLEEWLGEAAWHDGHYQQQDTIVVATQVVEVGLNISVGVMHTELAPANSLVQRVGRCARFQQQYGEVVVYPIPVRDDGKVSYKPYDEALCHATWEHLAQNLHMRGNSPLYFGFREEQAMIDIVHKAEDERMVTSFREHETQTQRVIMETLNTHDSGSRSSLIRNVESVSVVIHNEPQQEITINPFDWESFQVHPSSLIGAWEQLNARRDDVGADWVMKQLRPAGDDIGQDEDDNDRQPHYTWDDITDRRQISSASRLVLPSNLAVYDEELGFRLLLNDVQPSSDWISSPIQKNRKRYSEQLGKRGSYVEHITGLMRAYDWSVHREIAWVANYLEIALGLPDGSVDLAARLAIACHDIGKLAKAWQAWAHAWQALLVQEYGELYAVEPERAWLAKTDRRYWREEMVLRQKLERTPHPNHACAGVLAANTMVAQRVFEHVSADHKAAGANLTRAVLSAIARHHSPTAATYDAVAWDEFATTAIAAALAACRLAPDVAGLSLDSHMKGGELDRQCLIQANSDSPANALATWLGFVLVRALRLCDQRAERDW